MRKDVFEKKSNQMGDFYCYYQKPNSSVVTFGICTADLDIPYIQARVRKVKVAEDEVLLWNWRYNSPLKVPYNRIKKLTPLAAILKNG